MGSVLMVPARVSHSNEVSPVELRMVDGTAPVRAAGGRAAAADGRAEPPWRGTVSGEISPADVTDSR
jgi:hypothetical protein